MSDIFISYAREDRPRAEAIAKALEDHGWSVWWDRDIRAGKNIVSVIEDEIANARCVVVLWSATSVHRDWVNDEAREGNERNILVPVLVEQVRPPLGLRSMHAADLTNWAGEDAAPAFLRLRADIEALIGAPARAVRAEAAPAAEAARDPANPERHVFTKRMKLRIFNWRWLLGGALLAVLVLAGYLVPKLPVLSGTGPAVKKQPANRQPQTPVPQTNPGGNQASNLPVRSNPGAAPNAQPPNRQPPQSRTNHKDGSRYVRIPKGEFQMGAAPGDTDSVGRYERPRHAVRITKDFRMGDTPVTVAQYKRFVGERPRFTMPPAPDFNPEWGKLDHPIVRVTWDEAKAYCEWDGGGLPTEAQREYAARGGMDGLKYIWGNAITPENANYQGSKWNGTSPVRSYPANPWGLYDMAGNVLEWAADWYEDFYYGTLPPDQVVVDPRGPRSGTGRVLLGGCFGCVEWNLRAASRRGNLPYGRFDAVGFRCVREVAP